MTKITAQWQAHQRRWQQFHRWEATLSTREPLPHPIERLRWCEEALALHRRFVPPSEPVLEDEQVRHWRLIRRRLRAAFQ